MNEANTPNDPNVDPKKAAQEKMDQIAKQMPPPLTEEEQTALQSIFKEPKTSRAKIEKRLVNQYGFEIDELKVLFRTDDELARFFLEVVSDLPKMNVDDPSAPEVAYALTAGNKRDLAELELITKRQKRKQAETLKSAAEGGVDAKEKFEQSASSSEKKVTYEDFLKSLREGFADDLKDD
jgi:hypothetical protein